MKEKKVKAQTHALNEDQMGGVRMGPNSLSYVTNIAHMIQILDLSRSSSSTSQTSIKGLLYFVNCKQAAI